MYKIDNTESYFSKNAETWLLDAYEMDGYNYPTPLHRLRILKALIPTLSGIKRIIDVGCGGGNFAFEMAKKGFFVHGIDQSTEMLKIASQNMGQQGCKDLQKRVTFEHSSFNEIKPSNYDALTAMGFIGYLPDDELFFEKGSDLVRSNGYLIVSFRNRLFNLFSISSRTKNEIENGTINDLVNEYIEIQQSIDHNSCKSFLINSHKIIEKMIEDKIWANDRYSKNSPSEIKGKKYNSEIEPRQTTPKQAKIIAEKYGFKTIKIIGVHPHIMIPQVNNSLPPQVYNRLSNCLLNLENNEMSLLWSSVFIGVFEKKSD